ncbi:hypothetical protein GQ54DRAFT_302404 [Martensiomyces pterosporus]|nr:hypothetical protein GQ54DRAFT_302404 [Martensiomyces pterosporus]
MLCSSADTGSNDNFEMVSSDEQPSAIVSEPEPGLATVLYLQRLRTLKTLVNKGMTDLLSKAYGEILIGHTATAISDALVSGSFDSVNDCMSCKNAIFSSLVNTINQATDGLACAIDALSKTSPVSTADAGDSDTAIDIDTSGECFSILYLKHLVAMKESLNGDCKNLLPQMHMDALTYATADTPRAENSIRHAESTNECMGYLGELSDRICSINSALKTAIITYTMLLHGQSKEIGAVDISTSYGYIVEAKRGTFDALEFAMNPSEYLDSWIHPLVLEVSTEDINWRKFLLDYASPLVKYYVETDIPANTEWVGAKSMLVSTFKTQLSLEDMKRDRDTYAAMADCNRVLRHREQTRRYMTIQASWLAGVTTDKQQSVFVEALRRLYGTISACYLRNLIGKLRSTLE